MCEHRFRDNTEVRGQILLAGDVDSYYSTSAETTAVYVAKKRVIAD